MSVVNVAGVSILLNSQIKFLMSNFWMIWLVERWLMLVTLELNLSQLQCHPDTHNLVPASYCEPTFTLISPDFDAARGAYISCGRERKADGVSFWWRQNFVRVFPAWEEAIQYVKTHHHFVLQILVISHQLQMTGRVLDGEQIQTLLTSGSAMDK